MTPLTSPSARVPAMLFETHGEPTETTGVPVGSLALDRSSNGKLWQLQSAAGTLEWFAVGNVFDNGTSPTQSQVRLSTNGSGALELLSYSAGNQNILFDCTWNGTDFITTNNGGGRLLSYGGQYVLTGFVQGNGEVAAFNTLLTVNQDGTGYTFGGAETVSVQAVGSGSGALAAVSLTKATTTFITSGAATSTLAAGSAGLKKTVILTTDGGDLVLTVTDAAWGGAGTVTFNDSGDSVQLEYHNSKWCVTANNGCTLA